MEKSNFIEEKKTFLFKRIQYLRLLNDLRGIDEKIAGSARKEYKNTNSVSRWITDKENQIRKSRSDNFTAMRDSLMETLRQFKENNVISVYNNDTPSDIQELMAEAFPEPNPAVSKAVFAASVILDNEYKFIDRPKNLEYASSLLYNDEKKLNEYQKWIEKTYTGLTKQPLSGKQWGLIFATGAGLLALTLAAPIALIGGLEAAAPATATALAAIGIGDMQAGVGVIALFSALALGSGLGITYASLEAHNRRIVTDQFRQMNCSQSAQLLTLRAFVEHIAITEGLDEDDRKESLNDLFAMVSELKADTDYLLFVERENIADNRKKVELFHRFDDKMLDILRI